MNTDEANKVPSRQVIGGEYYSNILLISRRSAPLTTISEKRAKWYIDRDLAEEVLDQEREEKFPRYIRVVRLKFQAKLEDKGDPFYHQILETQCVVCGKKDGLTLHHVVPSVVRKFFPSEHKNHSHGWCVLLCEKHHGEADRLAQELHEQEVKELERKVTEVIKKMRDDWGKDYIRRQGGLENVKELYKKKFLKLNPQFVPEGFLADHEPRASTNPSFWQKSLTKATSYLKSVFK